MGWASVSLAGITRAICYQQYETSCALACVAMAINRFDGSQPTERAIMNILGGPRKIEHGYVPAAEDRKDPNLWKDDPYEGVYATAVPAYLNAYGIKSEYRFVGNSDYEPDRDPKMNGCAILKGLKTGRIMHFIFTEGIVNNQLIVLDPASNGTGGPALADFSQYRPYREITYVAQRGQVNFDIKEVITITLNAA